MTRVEGRAPANGVARQEAAVSSEPFDLGAATAAARAEAKGVREVRFSWGEDEFIAPVIPDWPDDAITLIGDNQLVEALEIVLGEEDFNRLRDAAGGSLTFRTIKLLLDHIAELSGDELGESSGSASSSRRTTRR